MAQNTLQTILRQRFPVYGKSHNLPCHILNAVQALKDCRTKALGGHVQKCPKDHYSRVWYNSCKHRICPQCASLQIERWLAKQKAKLLLCDHYHAIFTIPHGLNIYWLFNVRLMTTLLFAAVRETVFELLEDPKYLGAKPGVTATLHTWGQTLILHPHIHALITGGGLTKDKKWIAVTNGYLLPVRVVMALFRGKFIHGLKKSYHNGKLTLPNKTDPQTFLNLLNKLGHKKKTKWNVHIMKRYAHGVGVSAYLARYMKGGPIKNRRIISFTGETVTFIYTDNQKSKKENKQIKGAMTLKTDDFIKRLLLHVPFPGTQAVRHYGIYAGACKEKLSHCRTLLGQAPFEEPEEVTWQSYCEKTDKNHHEKCPLCGALLICVLRFAHYRDPPSLYREKIAA